ncbi:MAG: response regulator transcription factor, partial [Acidobacteria bacterium]|nr:response regulator transcription factor [Acidobacteriota bacterium]
IIRVLIVDDHPVVREGMAAILNCANDIKVVGEAADGKDAFRLFVQLKPDVTLIDLAMPEMNGVEVIKTIRKDFPNARFIVLTMYMGEVDIVKAIKAGAHAYLLKKAAVNEILDTIRAVNRGEFRFPKFISEKINSHPAFPELTARETEVLKFLAKGKKNNEIADLLGITTRTVKAHTKSIMNKLGASNRTQIISLALERGLIHDYDIVL